MCQSSAPCMLAASCAWHRSHRCRSRACPTACHAEHDEGVAVCEAAITGGQVGHHAPVLREIQRGMRLQCAPAVCPVPMRITRAHCMHSTRAALTGSFERIARVRRALTRLLLTSACDSQAQWHTEMSPYVTHCNPLQSDTQTCCPSCSLSL